MNALMVQPVFITAHSVPGRTGESLVMFAAPLLDVDGEESIYQAVVDATVDLPDGTGPFRLLITANRHGEFDGVLAWRVMAVHHADEGVPIHQPTQPTPAEQHRMDK